MRKPAGSVPIMPTQARVVWDESFTAYDFGPTHPMNPVRLDLTARLCEALGVFDADGRRGRRRRACRTTTSCAPSTTPTTSPRCGRPRVDPDVGRPEPRARHRGRPGLRRDARGQRADRRRARVDVAPRRVAGRGRARGQLLRRPAPRHARHRPRGFCIYNDVAVGDPVAARPRRAAGRLRRRRRPPRRRRRADLLGRPAGAHDLAARDRADAVPRHRLPAATSAARAPRARAVNVALPPGTGDAGWLRAFHAVVPAAACATFAPDVLVTQHGCDTHAQDPLAHLVLSASTASGRRTSRCTTWPTRSAGGRWVALGGGGYALVDVVPRAWTHLLGDRRARPVDPRHARCRRRGATHVRERLGRAGAAPG